MIYLVTGRPGAGKTSNTLAYVLAELGMKKTFFGLSQRSGRFFGRPFYVNHIDGLKEGLALPLSDESLRASEVPQDSVVIIDECHRLYPAMASGAAVPAHHQYWAEHRHTGVDVYMITQSPTSVAKFIRDRVDTHIHYARPFGLAVMSYTWAGVCDYPDKTSERKNAIKSRVSTDKKVFSLYTSTTLDTTSKKMPAVFLWLPVVLIAVVILIMSVLSFGAKETDDEVPVASRSGESAPVAALVTVPDSSIPAKPVQVTPFLDHKTLYYVGNIKGSSGVVHHYRYIDASGGTKYLTGSDLAAFGLVVQFRGDNPTIFLPDGTGFLIPPPPSRVASGSVEQIDRHYSSGVEM